MTIQYGLLQAYVHILVLLLHSGQILIQSNLSEGQKSDLKRKIIFMLQNQHSYLAMQILVMVKKKKKALFINASKF